jgi:hypothetical protein
MIEWTNVTTYNPKVHPSYLPTDSAARKKVPLATGCLDYFPRALAAVAEVSFIGNEKHNPGEPLHWSRGKSNDHPDCLMRHFMDRGKMDGKVRHSAEVAWRALAILELELEEASEKENASLPPMSQQASIRLPASV